MASFVLNPAGLIELCKAAPMQAGLLQEAQKMASAANADAYAHKLNTGMTVDPYGASVDVLDRTAVGVAYTRTKIAERNEAKYKSLSSQCH